MRLELRFAVGRENGKKEKDRARTRDIEASCSEREFRVCESKSRLTELY